MSGRRTAILFTVLSLLTAALFTADLLIGSVAVAPVSYTHLTLPTT